MKDSGGKLDELSHLLRPNALISAVAVTDAQVGDKQSVEWWPETLPNDRSKIMILMRL